MYSLEPFRTEKIGSSTVRMFPYIFVFFVCDERTHTPHACSIFFMKKALSSWCQASQVLMTMTCISLHKKLFIIVSPSGIQLKEAGSFFLLLFSLARKDCCVLGEGSAFADQTHYSLCLFVLCWWEPWGGELTLFIMWAHDCWCPSSTLNHAYTPWLVHCSVIINAYVLQGMDWC